ncbi:hypothetical protein M501DRAFT_779612 [Patellaria atrata CBS 101060]|uniref:GID complex catalytic subunit 2 n=1 Tax=Patellaria atrata CBS 101060 TaxID=1346257 RepID=A0A9P4VRF2_9PEZI|nr:hypothetical protein M501DRAFT_779612 [Patellaria atrata CBS 101060]
MEGLDGLLVEQAHLEKKGSLQPAVDDVQKTIDLLKAAREKIIADPRSAGMTLAKLQNPAKQSMDKVNDDLKVVYKALGNYTKALDKKFKNASLPTAENDALSSHPNLINRAIAMHLLREGQFGVASTFIDEANAHPPRPEPTPGSPNPYANDAEEHKFAMDNIQSQKLQQEFAEMYHILHELRQKRNLDPAIKWARKNSSVLEHRGSNLEFELCRLQYVVLFMGSSTSDGGMQNTDGPMRAWAYARSEFGAFQGRYSREIERLSGALSFWSNMPDSPYRQTFHNESAWEEVAHSFTREFCSLLGLSADSPLYIAATAGAIALPTLLKMQGIMKTKKTEWTTRQEMAVELPLPPAYHFHSIFVCPVSKEQGTDQNPPMMIPCGHVIAKETLERLSKGARFKCPYCPQESHPRDAKRVYL